MAANFKKDFPLLAGKKIVYLDSAATSQKPATVIRAVSDWYLKTNANVHRGTYRLAEQATARYEAARKTVADFIGAPDAHSIIFTKGTTESLNLVAMAWAKYNLKRGDVILLTEMEHHSNIVPWQLLAAEKKLRLRYWPIDRTGQLAPPNAALFARVKLLSLTYVSNVLGTVNPVESIIRQAHRKKIVVCVDAAQALPHLAINVKKLDPDFLAFSSHKMFGPTGVGVLYAKKLRLGEMRPYQGGGEMIETVTPLKSTYKVAPWKFEAGTQPLAGAIGLAAAIQYLKKIGLGAITHHDKQLTRYAYQQLRAVPGITVYGPPASKRLGVISFNLSDIHPHDLATWLDGYRIAVRAGHHCAQPLHQKLGITASARVSLALYNSPHDIDRLVTSLKKIYRQWQRSTNN